MLFIFTTCLSLEFLKFNQSEITPLSYTIGSYSPLVIITPTAFRNYPSDFCNGYYIDFWSSLYDIDGLPERYKSIDFDVYFSYSMGQIDVSTEYVYIDIYREELSDNTFIDGYNINPINKYGDYHDLLIEFTNENNNIGYVDIKQSVLVVGPGTTTTPEISGYGIHMYILPITDNIDIISIKYSEKSDINMNIYAFNSEFNIISISNNENKIIIYKSDIIFNIYGQGIIYIEMYPCDLKSKDTTVTLTIEFDPTNDQSVSSSESLVSMFTKLLI